MANCDICGRDMNLVKVKVEDVILNVCKNCSNFGEVIKEEKVRKVIRKETKFKNEDIEVIVSDYSKKIKEARESRNLTQKEVGEKLAEKESVIHKIESGNLEPSLELARKIEKFFGIRLIEIYKEEVKKEKINFKNSGLTIGDLLKMKK